MGKDKQLIANQKNAQRAGVKTVEGKLTIRKNALKHGIRSEKFLLAESGFSETAEKFDLIFDGLIEALNPNNEFELQLVLKMSKALFKMARIDCIEAESLAKCHDIIFLEREYLHVKHKEDFELILRYMRALDGEFYRAYMTLQSSRGKKHGFNEEC